MNRTGSNINRQNAADDATFLPASVNMAELDLRKCHEFGIIIQAGNAQVPNATHGVDVFLDNSTTPQTFFVTAGIGVDCAAIPLAIGCGSTPHSGA